MIEYLLRSETAPSEGTLKVFPDVILSNAYLILRPFFRAKQTPVSSDPLDPDNFEFGETFVLSLKFMNVTHLPQTFPSLNFPEFSLKRKASLGRVLLRSFIPI